MGSPIDVGGQYPFITFFTPPRISGKFLLVINSKIKEWMLPHVVMDFMDHKDINSKIEEWRLPHVVMDFMDHKKQKHSGGCGFTYRNGALG